MPFFKVIDIKGHSYVALRTVRVFQLGGLVAVSHTLELFYHVYCHQSQVSRKTGKMVLLLNTIYLLAVPVFQYSLESISST